MTNQVIPEAAVEAAARSLNDAFPQMWEKMPEWAREEERKTARAALEAAAPYMLAEAWDDGHSAGVDHADGLDGGSNPYGRQA
jgi:flagellar biosynthesis/type III secretory pathway protein FliH